MGMSREYYIAEIKSRFDIDEVKSIVQENIVDTFLDGHFDDKGYITKENIWDYAKDRTNFMNDNEVIEYILDNDLLEILEGAFN